RAHDVVRGKRDAGAAGNALQQAVEQVVDERGDGKLADDRQGACRGRRAAEQVAEPEAAEQAVQAEPTEDVREQGDVDLSDACVVLADRATAVDRRVRLRARRLDVQDG